MSPNFTLNLGVRYDIQKMRASGITNRAASLAAAGIDTGFINNDYDNIAPRIGFAWSPLASGRFVARGGYGMFYGRTPAIALGTAHSNNGLAVIPITINNPVLPFTYPGRFQSVRSDSRARSAFCSKSLRFRQGLRAAIHAAGKPGAGIWFDERSVVVGELPLRQGNSPAAIERHQSSILRFRRQSAADFRISCGFLELRGTPRGQSQDLVV